MGLLMRQEVAKKLYESIRHKMTSLLHLYQQNGYLINDQLLEVEPLLRDFFTYLFLDTDQFEYINYYVENITSDVNLIAYFTQEHNFNDIRENLKALTV
jgi:hypothetical protein